MLVYSFVFGKLFGVRSGDVPYPVYVYSGIILWLFFSASVSKASSGLVANRHMMNKVYFPRMVAPLVYIGSESVDLCASFIVLFIMMAFYKVTPGLSIFALPFFVCLVMLAGTALGLLLAALSVNVRDVGIALPIALMAWMYLSPVVYPISLIPDSYLSIYYLNPMAVIFQGYRWALLGAEQPPFTFLLGTAVLIGMGLVAAIYYFRHTERTMVDFL
jgi:lipopolysaccharide transport system permease protein